MTEKWVCVWDMKTNRNKTEINQTNWISSHHDSIALHRDEKLRTMNSLCTCECGKKSVDVCRYENARHNLIHYLIFMYEQSTSHANTCAYAHANDCALPIPFRFCTSVPTHFPVFFVVPVFFSSFLQVSSKQRQNRLYLHHIYVTTRTSFVWTEIWWLFLNVSILMNQKHKEKSNGVWCSAHCSHMHLWVCSRKRLLATPTKRQLSA